MHPIHLRQHEVLDCGLRILGPALIVVPRGAVNRRWIRTNIKHPFAAVVNRAAELARECNAKGALRLVVDECLTADLRPVVKWVIEVSTESNIRMSV